MIVSGLEYFLLFPWMPVPPYDQEPVSSRGSHLIQVQILSHVALRPEPEVQTTELKLTTWDRVRYGQVDGVSHCCSPLSSLPPPPRGPGLWSVGADWPTDPPPPHTYCPLRPRCPCPAAPALCPSEPPALICPRSKRR